MAATELCKKKIREILFWLLIFKTPCNFLQNAEIGWDEGVSSAPRRVGGTKTAKTKFAHILTIDFAGNVRLNAFALDKSRTA